MVINHNLIIDVVFLLMFLVSLFILKVKCDINKRMSNIMLDFLSRNFEILEKYEKRQGFLHIKKTVNLYYLIRKIGKFSKSNYVSFFKNDSNDISDSNDSNDEQKLNFVFSIDDDGYIVENSYLENIQFIYSDLMTDVLNNKDDLYEVFLNGDKIFDNQVYNALKRKHLSKLYIKGIYDSDKLIGVIVISYKDNYILHEGDKNEIINVADTIKRFI